MGRKSHKEVISLVCCSDSTFAEFEKFVVRWKKGEVSDVHGVVGPVENERGAKVDRDFSQLSVNRFRPVNGLLDSDLRLVWTQLEKGIVWVSRPTKLPEGLKLPEHSVSLKDYCKMLKGKRALAFRILRYWETRYKEEFDIWDELATSYTIPDNWLEGMLKFDKGDKGDKEVAGEDVSSSNAEEDDSSKKKKKPRKKTSVDHSLGSQDYQPSLKDSVQMRPYSMEYQPKGAGEDFVEEKGTASAAIKTNIKIKAPQWGFVGMASPDGSAYVHPVCKRRGFCNRMLNNFSSEGSTVLDFFSGGVFAREALMLQRDVIYFANNQEEAEFIGKYGKSLLNYSERVKHWFAKYKSAKKSASTIQQAVILAKKHANTQDDHIPADKKEQPPFVFEEVFTTDALERLGNRPRLQLTEDDEPETVNNVHLNNPRGLDSAEQSNDQGSLFQAVQQRNVEECEEEEPLALALNYCLGGLILEPVEHVDDALSPGQQQHVQVPRNTSGPLALTQMSMCPAPEFMQIDNTLVKASDLLPRKLLILDIEGLLVYAEGFMERTAKTAARDAIGSKKVIRRNNVEGFISRCFDLFDLALWTCTDSNALREYMFYLFSGEQ
ncbi:hypothetical protein R1sor_011076 [Riccia sorocarpa]|uniref:FCP1 homology domain-containing protein n=1 Tax=Riccia sorocarpa TaxID=122646 RepID=A0ABD3I3H1_9MARC